MAGIHQRHAFSSYFVPRSNSRPSRSASLFASISWLYGNAYWRDFTSFATVEKIGPSSDASAVSFRRHVAADVASQLSCLPLVAALALSYAAAAALAWLAVSSACAALPFIQVT